MADVTVQELAAALIACFEGCRLTAYRDSGGVLTIGYGHTGPDVIEGQVISESQAFALLQKDIAHLLPMVYDVKKVTDAAALVSFGYNCGASNLVKIMQGHATVDQFTRDRHGNVLPGLVARRRLEELLMLC